MLAYIVLLLAVLSRILPHAFFHEVSWNFTAIGGGLLFFGSRMNSGESNSGPASSGMARPAIKLAAALAILIATDYYLTVYAYKFPFHVGSYLITWVWYAAVCLIGMGLLSRPTALRVVAGVLASATSFFFLSNFAVWMYGDGIKLMYPHTLSGLGTCLAAGLPFYRNDLVSTAITAGALFGLPVLAAKIAESMHAIAGNNNFPTA